MLSTSKTLTLAYRPAYLETTRAVLKSQKQPSPGPSFQREEPSLPDSI
jgi:hypothetical protein